MCTIVAVVMSGCGQAADRGDPARAARKPAAVAPLTTTSTTLSEPISSPTTLATTGETLPPTPPEPTPPPSPAAPLTTAAVGATSWPCTYGDDPVGSSERSAQFTSAIERSQLPASTRSRLHAALPNIEASMWMYCEAEHRTGVEALLLAAIHYREANNDPARSVMSGETIGARNPDTGVVEGTDRLDNAVRAAQHLAGNAASFYRVDLTASPSPLEVGFAALAYNRGGMYCRVPDLHPMESPYVAGGLVDATVDMAWPAVGGGQIGSGSAWGEPASVRGKPDRRLGVLALMRGFGSPTLTQAFSFNTAETPPGCK